jgi:uncharacterized membrane protein
MNAARFFRHLFASNLRTRRRFPANTLAAIERAVRESEARHSGEVRFVIETGLEGQALWRGTSARERAHQVFARIGVWDTELRNGVLIYLLLADRDVEILADRGLGGRVAPQEWEGVCREMEREFAAGRYEEGAIAGVRGVSALLERHFPPRDSDRNALADRPEIL